MVETLVSKTSRHGVRDFLSFSLAKIAKQVWRLINEQNPSMPRFF
jgi:hypothetical protein